MGKHVGWRVRRVGDRWQGLATLPGGRYRSRSFRSQGEARRWAQDEAAQVRLGGDGGTGLRPTAVEAEAYVASLAAAGRSWSHLANVRRDLAGAAEAATRLDDPRAGARLAAWLAGLHVAPATRNRALVTVRALCRWLIRWRRLREDPTAAIGRAAVPKLLRPQFSVDECVRLMALPSPDPPVHRRLALLLLAGLRDDEAAALRWSDVDLAGGSLAVRRVDGHRLKRNKERIVALQPALAALLVDPTPPAFPPYPGDTPERRQPYEAAVAAALARGREQVAPLIDRNLRRAFPAYLRALGIPVDGRSAHSLRHTYAALMTATGVPTALLAAYMGHESQATTATYAALAARHVRAVEGWRRGVILG